MRFVLVLIIFYVIIAFPYIESKLPMSTIYHYRDYPNATVSIYFNRTELNNNCCIGSITLTNVELIEYPIIGKIYLATTYYYMKAAVTEKRII